jgi:hypothetical protein
MEREHLIIIALILVALYMMNNDKKQDTVKAISPMGRIRYGECPGPDCIGNMGHIRTRREGFFADNDGTQPLHIRIRGDRDYGQGHFIKGHVRHNNRNNMFSGMMGGCSETFRMEDVDPANSAGEQP